MRTYIFSRDEDIIGVIVCPKGIVMTMEQTKKILDAGINVTIKEGQIPKHDGDMNRLIDLLIES